jgi:ParB family chromosome partitioning protein
LEEAAAYQQLLSDFGCTQEELSGRIKRSRPHISNTIRLLQLPAPVQRRVAAGVLSAGHARAILALGDPLAMERLAQRVVAENLSVRAVEEIVALGDGATEKRTRARVVREPSARASALADRLIARLDTRVNVVMGAKGKGRIVIDFAGDEDLERLAELLGDYNSI